MTYIPSKVTTEWIPYTTTCSHSTNTTVAAWYRRVGDSIDVRFTVFYNGSPGTPGNLTFTLPEGIVVDTSKVSGDPGVNCAAAGYINDSGVGYYGPLMVGGGSSGTVSIYYRNASNGQLNSVTHAAPISLGTNDGVRVTVMGLPVVGW